MVRSQSWSGDDRSGLDHSGAWPCGSYIPSFGDGRARRLRLSLRMASEVRRPSQDVKQGAGLFLCRNHPWRPVQVDLLVSPACACNLCLAGHRRQEWQCRIGHATHAEPACIKSRCVNRRVAPNRSGGTFWRRYVHLVCGDLLQR